MHKCNKYLQDISTEHVLNETKHNWWQIEWHLWVPCKWSLICNQPIFLILSYKRRTTIRYFFSPFHRAFQFTMCDGPPNALVCNKTLIQMSHIKTLKITPTCFDHQLIIIIRELIWSLLKSVKILVFMYGELGYAAAYVHLFCVLSCVERYVDFSRHTSPHMWTCRALTVIKNIV
jgi:hypothetical protein